MRAEASSSSALAAKTRASSAGVGERPVSSTRPASMAAAMLRSEAVIAGEAAALLVREQRVDDRVEAAVEDTLEVAGREPDAMIGEAILREIVRADLLAPVARSDLRTPRARGLFLLLSQLRFIEVGAQQLHSAFAVLELRSLLLARDDRACRSVRYANGRLSLVDVLAAGALCAVGVDLQVGRIDLDLDGVDLGHDRDRRGRCVDPSARFRRGHALDAVDAALVLEQPVGPAALHADHRFFI